MTADGIIAEKHDGALGGGANVRTWLRLLSCTMTIEKIVQRRLAAQFGATLPRFDVLAALDRRGEAGLTMGELSRALLVSNGNITAILQSLLRDGHVASAPHPEDRRSSIVTLTDAGKRHFRDMAAEHHRWIDALFAGVTDAERDGLHAALGHLKASMATALQDDAA